MINVEFLGKTNFTYITIEMSSCSFEEMHYAIKVLQKLFSSKICYFLYSKIAMNALDNAKCEIVEEININMKQTEETIKINNFLEESITYHPIGKIEEVDFMLGLSGIGYQYLKLIFDKLPCVCLLEI